MRNVAMLRLGFPIFLEPFHDPAVGADLGGRQPGAFGLKVVAKVLVRAQDFRGIDTGAEKIPNICE